MCQSQLQCTSPKPPKGPKSKHDILTFTELEVFKPGAQRGQGEIQLTTAKSFSIAEPLGQGCEFRLSGCWGLELHGVGVLEGVLGVEVLGAGCLGSECRSDNRIIFGVLKRSYSSKPNKS